MARRRRLAKPIRLTDLIDNQTRRWRFQKLHRLEVIRQKWIQAAGDYVAQHVSPIRLVRKTLRVAVEDSGWASEMAYLAATILERLQTLLPGKWVEEIRVVLNEPLPPLEHGDKRVILSEPSGEMQARVERVCSQVEDQQLSETIRKAMLKSLCRLDAERGSGVDREKSGDQNGERS